MDKKSMGTFLTDLRKEKGLTQQEVADNLNVSNKTISKWERDEGYPEITMLSTIAKFYEITTDELLNGERLARGTLTEETTVKKVVSEIIGEEYIIPTLGVWNKFDDINFDNLPNLESRAKTMIEWIKENRKDLII